MVAVVPEFPARTTLTPHDRVVLRAVAEAMFSQDGEVERARLDAHVDEVDAFISAASKPLRFGLRVALFIVSIAPLLLLFRMRRIDQLCIEERVIVLSRLERSRITNLTLAFIGWRTVMTLVFYEDASELAKLGYAGEERKVYKRRLPTLAPVLVASTPPPPTTPPMLPMPPIPDESGVRLRSNDAESASEADSVTNKVA